MIRVERTRFVDIFLRMKVERVVYSKLNAGGCTHEPKHLYKKRDSDT